MPFQPTEPEQAWATCLGKSSLLLCGRRRDSVYEFRFSEFRRFSAASLRLQQAILDSLRQRYGADQVQVCNWVIAGDKSDCVAKEPGR